jgi:hypothetical protein
LYELNEWVSFFDPFVGKSCRLVGTYV